MPESKCIALVESMESGEYEKKLASSAFISGPGLNGSPVSMANMEGQVFLIDFWATWCGPCRGETPHIKEAYAAYHKQGFEVIQISLDRDREALVEYVKEHGLPWPQITDRLDNDDKLSKRFKVTGIPKMMLVDKEGNVIAEGGAIRGERLAPAIESALKKIKSSVAN